MTFEDNNSTVLVIIGLPTKRELFFFGIIQLDQFNLTRSGLVAPPSTWSPSCYLYGMLAAITCFLIALGGTLKLN